jgi:hypothetical protein
MAPSSRSSLKGRYELRLGAYRKGKCLEEENVPAMPHPSPKRKTLSPLIDKRGNNFSGERSLRRLGVVKMAHITTFSLCA